MKLKIAFITLGVLVLAGIVVWLVAREQPTSFQEERVTSTTNEQPISTVQDQTETDTDADIADTSDNSTELAAGRYVEYGASFVGAAGYANTILFFHAPWCPECRAFEQAIESSGMPDGVQILKIDYDTSQDLRSQYGVTVQTTFVRVDSDGNLQKKWVGYGEDKSTAAIIENTA